jgi:hypothetical protein
MIRRIVSTTLIATALAAGAVTASYSQEGVPGGMERGAREGERAAGPVGAVVGGTVGAVTGGVAGILGVDQRPRFRSYVVERHYPSYRYEGPVRVGTILPADGVTYYEVPREYGATGYRYTIINDEPVLVEPRTRRIVEVIE